jgi:hypothetical protein
MRPAAAALACLLLAACGSQSEKDWQSAASWSLTAVVVARYWERGDVPTPYARRALKKASDELSRGPLPEAAEPVDELRQALERGDREAVRRLAQELSGR